MAVINMMTKVVTIMMMMMMESVIYHCTGYHMYMSIY